MGYRMTIEPEGKHDEQVGDDHKFYGYNDFEAVKDSFGYLFPLLKEQDCFLFDYDTPEDAYDLVMALSSGPEVTLSEEQFATFMDLYLADIAKRWSKLYPEDWESSVERIRGYMERMKNTPGNKVLFWG